MSQLSPNGYAQRRGSPGLPWQKVVQWACPRCRRPCGVSLGATGPSGVADDSLGDGSGESDKVGVTEAVGEGVAEGADGAAGVGTGGWSQ